MYLQTDEGVFEIFEPTKVRDQMLLGQTPYEENILQGYKSETESFVSINNC